MTIVRVMTYRVKSPPFQKKGAEPDRLSRVISASGAKVIGLQGVELDDLEALSRLLGMEVYPGERGLHYLSDYPLKGLRNYDLGEEGTCLKADADIDGKRLHLLNVQLSAHPLQRRGQLQCLFGEELLGSGCLPCSTLVVGAFADFSWGVDSLFFNIDLHRVSLPFWCSTFPSFLPLWGSDRIYYRGNLKVHEGRIDRSSEARLSSLHLPFTAEVEILDNRTYLRIEKEELNRGRMEIAPG